jgi:hypothetical protein
MDTETINIILSDRTLAIVPDDWEEEHPPHYTGYIQVFPDVKRVYTVKCYMLRHKHLPTVEYLFYGCQSLFNTMAVEKESMAGRVYTPKETFPMENKTYDFRTFFGVTIPQSMSPQAAITSILEKEDIPYRVIKQVLQTWFVEEFKN